MGAWPLLWSYGKLRMRILRPADVVVASRLGPVNRAFRAHEVVRVCKSLRKVRPSYAVFAQRAPHPHVGLEIDRHSAPLINGETAVFAKYESYLRSVFRTIHCRHGYSIPSARRTVRGEI